MANVMFFYQEIGRQPEERLEKSICVANVELKHQCRAHKLPFLVSLRLFLARRAICTIFAV